MLLPPSPHRHLVGGRRLLIDQAQLALRAIVQADQPVEVCAHHGPIPSLSGRVFVPGFPLPYGTKVKLCYTTIVNISTTIFDGETSFFPTCQVVSRFYMSYFFLLLLGLVLTKIRLPSRPQRRAPDFSAHCRTSTASARSQWALPMSSQNRMSDRMPE